MHDHKKLKMQEWWKEAKVHTWCEATEMTVFSRNADPYTFLNLEESSYSVLLLFNM